MNSPPTPNNAHRKCLLIISIILEAAVMVIAILAARDRRPYMYGLAFTFGDVMFSKGLEFHTRAHALPTVRKRCTVTIPPVGGHERVVPCR